MYKVSEQPLRGTFTHQTYNNSSRKNIPVFSQMSLPPQSMQALQNCNMQGNSARFCGDSFDMKFNADQYSVNQNLSGNYTKVGNNPLNTIKSYDKINGEMRENELRNRQIGKEIGNNQMGNNQIGNNQMGQSGGRIKNNDIAGVNPRVNIPPVIVPRSHDLDSWRANELVVHSHINDATNIDTYQSGYDVSECCGYTPRNTFLTPGNMNNMEEIDGNTENTKNNGNIENIIEFKSNVDNGEVIDGGEDYREEYREEYTNKSEHRGTVKENYCNRRGYDNISKSIDGKLHGDTDIYNTDESYNRSYTYPYNCDKNVKHLNTPKPPISGDINTACGYNPDQIYTSNLPSNYLSGNCDKSVNFRDYNKDLFTTTLQPGVYVNNQVMDPINNNIGISFTQQFQPTTVNRTEKLVDGGCDNGVMVDTETEYTRHDPRMVDIDNTNYVPEDISLSNVYNPRHYGYGTSYRGYLNPEQGRVDYYYDDIDAIRMPNYISRSKIDFEPYSDAYGPMKSEEESAFNHKNIRALANDSHMRAQLNQRTDLQERLMRKSNTMIAQRRIAPLSRGRQ